MKQSFEKKLMHSVLENDKPTIDQGKMIKDAINQGLSTFNPSMLFEQMVNNYGIAKSIMGESIIREITGYDPKYVEKNIKIPEFQRDLKKRIQENADRLKKEGLVDKEYNIKDEGVELAALVNYVEELDHMTPKGMLGEKIHKKDYMYGDKEDVKNFKKGLRYRDIALKKSIKQAIRRNHSELEFEDLKAFEKQAKGQVYVIYGLDASGSMKGTKIAQAKKAGIALAYKAISSRDKVGLIVFSKELETVIEPCQDFPRLLKEMTQIRAFSETNFEAMIKKSIELFPSTSVTKHIVLLSDALPTSGDDPEKATMEAVNMASANNITISLIGIGLDEKGQEFAKKITEIGNGRFYIAKNLEDIDKIMLEDYRSVI